MRTSTRQGPKRPIFIIIYRNCKQFPKKPGNSEKRPGNDLGLGDVGQTKREEVNLIVAGGNYGWPFREGTTGPQPAGGSIDPVFELDHDEAVAVIDGFTYRGTELSDSIGDHIWGDWSGQFAGSRLFYGDPNTGEEFAFIIDPKGPRFTQNRLMPLRLLTVGQDENNELYIGASVSGAGQELSVASSLLNSVSRGKHFLGEIGCRNDVFARNRSSLRRA